MPCLSHRFVLLIFFPFWITVRVVWFGSYSETIFISKRGDKHVFLYSDLSLTDTIFKNQNKLIPILYYENLLDGFRNSL